MLPLKHIKTSFLMGILQLPCLPEANSVWQGTPRRPRWAPERNSVPGTGLAVEHISALKKSFIHESVSKSCRNQKEHEGFTHWDV